MKDYRARSTSTTLESVGQKRMNFSNVPGRLKNGVRLRAKVKGTPGRRISPLFVQRLDYASLSHSTEKFCQVFVMEPRPFHHIDRDNNSRRLPTIRASHGTIVCAMFWSSRPNGISTVDSGPPSSEETLLSKLLLKPHSTERIST